jgi:arsenite methyltransferase
MGVMVNPLMRVLDAAFGHPRGVAGRIGGALMVRSNAEQERWAVRHADLHPGMRVLVVGPGPGVGLILAAAAVGPDGRVIGVDPSETMRDMARARCADQISADVIELRDGTAEYTGCGTNTVDAVISVNNVMMWDRAAGLSELHRVLRPGGQLVITVHRHVLDFEPEELQRGAVAAGFIDISLNKRKRRFNSPAVELLARRGDT